MNQNNMRSLLRSYIKQLSMLLQFNCYCLIRLPLIVLNTLDDSLDSLHELKWFHYELGAINFANEHFLSCCDEDAFFKFAFLVNMESFSVYAHRLTQKCQDITALLHT